MYEYTKWAKKNPKQNQSCVYNSLAVNVRNKISSLLLAALQTRIDTGKAIIGEIVPQALKSYQHEGWD